MYSMAGDGAAGLQAWRKWRSSKPRHAPGFDRLPWEKIYYQEGTIQFWYRDLDGGPGEHQEESRPAATKLDLNTGVLAWLRMGQIYDLTHRRAQALEAYKRPSRSRPMRKRRRNRGNTSGRPTAACKALIASCYSRSL